jgi:ABC-type polysaccharide/polyol phosphate export permease
VRAEKRTPAGAPPRGPDWALPRRREPAELVPPAARVHPRTTSELIELGTPPPERERFPVSLRASVVELVRAREVLFTFVERDLRLRYRQMVLGAAWAVLQPLLFMVVFTFVFGRIARVGSEGVPYPVFAYVALVPWALFTSALGYGTVSIVANSAIVRKIQLPREVFALASVASALVDFAVSSVLLLVMLLAYGFGPRLTWFAYPALLLVLIVLATALTLIACLITVYFRDTRYAVPTLLQLALYATPVAYPLSRALRFMPSGLRAPYPYLNPLAPVMDGFRRVLLHGQWPQWGPLGVAAGVAAVAVTAAYRLYKHADPTFADVI